mgnify:CR=1 FL=1
MANSVNYTVKRLDGSEVVKNISNVNPAAADSDVAVFVATLANLSDNTLTAIEKVENEDVVIVPDTEIYAESHAAKIINSNFEKIYTGSYDDTIQNSLNAVTISAGDGNDSINNSGANVSILSGKGADTVVNTGNNVTIRTNTPTDTKVATNDLIINSGDNVSIYGTGVTVNNSGNNVSMTSNYSDTLNTRDYINSGDNCVIFFCANTYIKNTGQHCSLSPYGNRYYVDTIDNSAHGYTYFGKLVNQSGLGNYNVTLCNAEGHNTINCGGVQYSGTVNVYGFNQETDLFIVKNGVDSTKNSIFSGHTVNSDNTDIYYKHSNSKGTHYILHGVTSGTIRYALTTSDAVQLYNLNPENENTAMPDDENLFIADI